MAKLPILDLDSVTDRTTVKVDGHFYELLTPGSMPPIDAHRFSQHSVRQGVLLRSPELTEAEAKELESLPTLMCRLVLAAPPEVIEKLTPRQCSTVVSVFLEEMDRIAMALEAPAPVQGQPITLPSTGATPSPVSVASTEAAP